MHKLGERQVREIRQHLAEGRYTGAKIAELYGVTGATISHIKSRKSYRWVK
jgi:hypothetical protein